MRWFTCTPVDFGGGADFFARDSGLLCRGFQALGHESMAVMPGNSRPEDDPSLLRTDYVNLESPGWWRDLGLDGVVLYAWGKPGYGKVARAIRDAGIFLVLNQDNGGLISPLAGFRGWLREQRIMAADGIDFLRSIIKGLAGVVATDPGRAAHLKHGDVIACVSPEAARHYRRLCSIYGSRLSDRVRMIPHPVEPAFSYQSQVKSRTIVCLGRWDDEVQKRPRVLAKVIELVLASDPGMRFEVAGSPGWLETWHAGLVPDVKARITLHGRISRDRLADMMAHARIFYSSSAYESFGIAAAESLCSGCSVVAARSVSMASFEWFVSKESGRLITEDRPERHAKALMEEMHSWDAGERDPAVISAGWSRLLHADQVAARVVGLK